MLSFIIVALVLFGLAGWSTTLNADMDRIWFSAFLIISCVGAIWIGCLEKIIK